MAVDRSSCRCYGSFDDDGLLFWTNGRMIHMNWQSFWVGFAVGVVVTWLVVAA